MIKVGEKFVEETEHHEERYVVTRVEGDYVYARRIHLSHDTPYESAGEKRFTEEELLKGNIFASYWFER